MTEPAAIATLQPGDEVFVSPRIGFQVVREVVTNDDGTVGVWYVKRGEEGYSHGVTVSHDRLVERRLVDHAPADPVLVRRGTPAAVAELVGEMLEQAEQRVQASERRSSSRRGRR